MAGRRRWRSALGSLLLLSLSSVLWGQDEFFITFRDGTVLRTPLAVSTLPWQRVDSQGNVVSEELRLATVAKLELAVTPASQQLLAIREYLAKLQSDNYHTRNEAEAGLVKWGGQFIDVLTAARESSNAEVRYRVGRVLKRLQGKDAKRVDADFDVLTASTGDTTTGDLGFESLEVRWGDRSITVARGDIHQIERIVGGAASSSAPAWVNASFSQPGTRFYQAADTHINFETGRLNESFAKFEPIPMAYAFRGARLIADCGDEPATIVTAGFAIDQGRSRKNSAATMMNRNTKKYLGAIQIDFCQPGIPEIPAAVHRAGCYIALVDHPRDFVLEAYSVDGQIVASAEALEKTSFLGVESEIPIVSIRIQPNRNLRVDPADQDDNFVIDDLTYDSPAPICRPIPERLIVTTIEGSRFLCDALEFDAQAQAFQCSLSGVLKTRVGQISLSPQLIDTISFPASLSATESRRGDVLWGFFLDGTQLPLDVQSAEWTVMGQSAWSVVRSDLAGVWGGARPLRHAADDDLASGKTVIVNPAERWFVDEVQIGNGLVSWDAAAAELREPIALQNSTHAPDSTSQFDAPQAPSIWWRKPSPFEPENGWVRLHDGRVFTLHGALQIKLNSIDHDGVVLAHGEIQLPIRWSEISAIRFPRVP